MILSTSSVDRCVNNNFMLRLPYKKCIEQYKLLLELYNPIHPVCPDDE